MLKAILDFFLTIFQLFINYFYMHVFYFNTSYNFKNFCLFLLIIFIDISVITLFIGYIMVKKGNIVRCINEESSLVEGKVLKKSHIPNKNIYNSDIDGVMVNNENQKDFYILEVKLDSEIKTFESKKMYNKYNEGDIFSFELVQKEYSNNTFSKNYTPIYPK